jgi:hypothetical protein
MKTRNGWVSNSSTSSFICGVCEEVEAGMDLSLSDIDMTECENGHLYCEGHAVSDFSSARGNRTILQAYLDRIHDGFKKRLEEDKDNDYLIRYEKESDEDATSLRETDNFENWLEENDGLFDDFRYSSPQELCPICQLESIPDKDIMYYLAKVFSVNIDSLKKELRDKFGSYSEFKKFLEK